MNQPTDDDQGSYERFVARVKETRTVWGLKASTGWAVCESNEYEETDVYPFWSEEADARVHCTDDWARFEPTGLPLDVFIDTWLPGMSEDGVLVGTDWDAELSGIEIEPGDLARDLLG
jgi:hypothetical protein